MLFLTRLTVEMCYAHTMHLHMRLYIMHLCNMQLWTLFSKCIAIYYGLYLQLWNMQYAIMQYAISTYYAIILSQCID